ncbi:MAG: glycosyltransferase family 4 protein [Bacteroidales bacterium]|nr:glycosyltransferase family 4 protein [Bacteroidales bacterium]
MFEEGVLSMSLKDLDYGLNSYERSFKALPGNIKKYLGVDFKIRIFRSYDRKLLKDKQFRNLRKIISFAKIVKKENYRIIHYNGISGFMLYLVIFLRKSCKVWTLHDYLPHSGEEDKRSFGFQKLLMKFNFHYIQHYKYLRDQLIKLYHLPEEKVNYIPSGTLTVFKDFEPDFIIPSSVKYVLFFGRISKYKGIDYLVQAFDQVSKDFPDVKLLIAGQGVLWFVPGSNENIIFLNRYIKTSELCGLIKNSLFVAVPYTDATHSAVVATSYAFLKPVISSNVGGLSEVVKDGITGFLVPPKDSDTLASKIEQLISDTELLEQMQDNIRSITTSGEYSWSQIVLKMQESYAATLSNRNDK